MWACAFLGCCRSSTPGPRHSSHRSSVWDSCLFFFDAFSDPRMPGESRRSHRGDLGRRVRTCGGSTRAGVRSMIKQAALPGPRTTWRQIHAGWNNSEIAPRAHPLRRSVPPPPHRVRHRSRPTLPRSSASRRLTRWFALPDDRDRAIDGEPPRLAIGDRNGRRD